MKSKPKARKKKPLPRDPIHEHVAVVAQREALRIADSLLKSAVVRQSDLREQLKTAALCGMLNRPTLDERIDEAQAAHFLRCLEG